MAVVVITGTSSGVGLAAALHFARRGDQVYATMRNLDRSGRLREAATAEKLPITLLQLDVDDEVSVQQAIGEVLDCASHIDVLVNNAGIGVGGPLEQADEALLRAGFETHVFGPLRTIRAVLPSMRARQQGVIVNVTSVFGRCIFPGLGFYHATKYALEALSEVLALEVAPFGIRVVIVEPGFTETAMADVGRSVFAQKPPSPYDATFYWFNRLGQDPLAVAQVIEHAITTPEPKLRYLVGPDAQVVGMARARMSDEEWMDLIRAMGQEGFLREFIARSEGVVAEPRS
jgi:NAD(P)-dependent dehydrogenase (short-subunit alcohol dehydrogenase family)